MLCPLAGGISWPGSPEKHCGPPGRRRVSKELSRGNARVCQLAVRRLEAYQGPHEIPNRWAQEWQLLIQLEVPLPIVVKAYMGVSEMDILSSSKISHTGCPKASKFLHLLEQFLAGPSNYQSGPSTPKPGLHV